jgi:predicted nucleic acid-binding protein
LIYLDSSALVKLVASEPESKALAEYLAEQPDHISSAIALVEVMRAVRRLGAPDGMQARADVVLRSVALFTVDESVLRRAATLEPRSLRTLDSIHLATALLLGEDLSGFIVYDTRLSDAAQQHGLPLLAPGA